MILFQTIREFNFALNQQQYFHAKMNSQIEIFYIEC